MNLPNLKNYDLESMSYSILGAIRNNLDTLVKSHQIHKVENFMDTQKTAYRFHKSEIFPRFMQISFSNKENNIMKRVAKSLNIEFDPSSLWFTYYPK